MLLNLTGEGAKLWKGIILFLRDNCAISSSEITKIKRIL